MSPSFPFPFSFFVLLQAVLASVVASQSTCWRNTTCTGPLEASFPGPWESNSFSPSTRTVSPVLILNPDKSILSNFPGTATLQGNGSLLIFDFGQEVGGVVTVEYSASGTGALGLAFTEANNFTGEWSDSSNGAFGPDGALYANITTTSAGSYTGPDAQLRGGFRYLSLFTTTNSSISVDITAITLEISYQPSWSNLRAYGGYFQSSDELLNRIWYAGAYTLQTNAVPPNTGRVFPLQATGWSNDAFLGSGESIFVDGSKRDRAVWAGDLGIAIPSVMVSTGDWESAKNSLQVQYDNQVADTGALPMVGPPINFQGSDTYHMSTMIGTYDYVLYSNDSVFFSANWAKYQLAMNFITGKIDSTGLLDVTGTADWGRLTQGGHNSEANMLLYQVLITGSTLAIWANEPSLNTTWMGLAQTLKSAINENNWDDEVGAFKDSDTDASIHPEDANGMALLFGVADPPRTENISTQLTTNWGPIGAICPELPNNIVPFVEGFEIKGHLQIREATRALDLIRLSWGWYLNNPSGTGSSLIEGYLSDGTFGYRSTTGYDNDPSYPSHAHGWATGPTHALTSYIVGLTLTGQGGETWQLAPQFADLSSAEGGFTAGLGLFQAGWSLTTDGYALNYSVPVQTQGTLMLSTLQQGTVPNIMVDGAALNATGGVTLDSTGTVATFSATGGSHMVVVTP